MMRIFSRKPRADEVTPPASVLDLQQRMERLERDIRDLKTDWNTTYDKFHSLTMRMRKRAKIEEEKLEKGPEDPPGDANGDRRVSNPLAEQLLRRGRL